MMKRIPPTKLTSAVFIEKTPAGSLALAATETGLAQLFFCTRKDFDAFLAANTLQARCETQRVDQGSRTAGGRVFCRQAPGI